MSSNYFSPSLNASFALSTAGGVALSAFVALILRFFVECMLLLISHVLELDTLIHCTVIGRFLLS